MQGRDYVTDKKLLSASLDPGSDQEQNLEHNQQKPDYNTATARTGLPNWEDTVL